MAHLRLPHIIATGCVALVFAAMALASLGFAEKASWFPLYTGIAGFLLAAAATIAGIVVVLRRRARQAPEAAPSAPPTVESGTIMVKLPPHIKLRSARVGDDDDLIEAAEEAFSAEDDQQLSDNRALLHGFAWLGAWIGFLLTVLIVGFLVGSVLWLAVWFRTVHKWPFKTLVPVIVGVAGALWLAEAQLGMEMPGGTGWLGSLLGF